MSRRGPYMKYYDANSQETMPRSTLYEKEGLRKSGSCEGNIIEKDIIKTHTDQQLPTTKTVEHEVQHGREETIDTDMSDVVPECSSFSSEVNTFSDILDNFQYISYYLQIFLQYATYAYNIPFTHILFNNIGIQTTIQNFRILTAVV